MQREYTHKVVFHEVEDSQKVKHIQLFGSEDSANQWASIQQCRGFTPVSVEDNTDVDADMYHIGDVSPQVHAGHYAQPTRTHHP